MTKSETIYDEIKSRYIQHYGKTGWFYKDYFENDNIDYFTESLQENEPWLSNSQNVLADDIDTIWDTIKDGIFNSSRITRMVDGLTDKHYPDYIE